jgi:hypothetical protein
METNSTQETEFVFRRLEEALRLFGRETDPRWFWVFVLCLVLAAGFTYVVWMYRRDSRSVGWPWAAFLAVLRCAVYAILAAVFLLPAEQTWEKTETRSKVLMPLDVSGSTGSKDDVPSETMPAEKLLTRQDKVIQFLMDERVAFLKALQDKNPVYLYRFGSRVDEDFQVLQGGKAWTLEEWNAWLKPDPKEAPPKDADDEIKAKFLKRLELHQQLVNGTNLGDSLLEVLNRESNNMLQGIIVVSDGRSTQSSSQAFEELRARAHRAKVPIFTVAVGEHRQPISIRITDLQAPKQARPDDKFPVRVEVDGDGLPDRETIVYLDVTSPRGDMRTLDKPFKFNAGSGGPPHAQIEFDIDAAQLGNAPAPGKKPELEEGEWKLRARVPRDKREVFLEKEHIKDKVAVQVIRKPLRVLLFAGSASHDYQFLRNLLVREADQHRAELSIYLQLQREGIVQDVAPDRFLKHFPDRLGAEAGEGKGEDRYYNLSEYDLIIAFDPDWSQLQPEQLAALEKWVNMQAGGLILVAGPVNTYQLARLGNRDKLKPILDLFPVLLQDSVLEGLVGRPTTEPWRLHFPGATAEMEFLKLDEEGKEQLAGWEEFFTGRPQAEAAKDAPVVHGFYSYYPVEGVKPSATVVATFSDPRARLRDGTKEQPYLVTMPYGSGKVVYIGSGESWRLRQAREVYHERFWMKLARYAGSGTLTRLSRRGVLVMGREFTAGQIVRLEAQLFGRDLQPLSANATPKIQLQPPAGVTMPTTVELTARKREGDEWTGWFQGRFRVMSPGDYRLELHIPETGDVLPERFTVKESNPELDNTRPDFGQMYQLASEVGEVLPRLDKQAQDELKRTLEGTAARLLPRAEDKNMEQAKGEAPAAKPGDRKPDAPSQGGAENKEALRLFFDLNSAKLIPKCMVTDTKVQRSRGPVKDLWDEGFTLSSEPKIQMATVLLLVAMLLSIEWLTRKLLKLA